MFKLSLILSVMVIADLVLAEEKEDCSACGTACEPLCGKKKFRICCIQNMRKKREAVDTVMAPSANKLSGENAYQNHFYSNEAPAIPLN